MIVAAREHLDEALLVESMPLVKASSDEVENGPELEMDIPGLLNAELTGQSASYTLRDEGQLIGYIHVCLSGNMHFRSLIIAIVDSIYIVPRYRRGNLARQFIKRVEDDLASMQIRQLAFYIKVEHDYEKLFMRMHYICSEKIYVKDLGNGTSVHTGT